MFRDEIKSKLQTIFRDVFGNSSIELRDEMTAEDVDDWDSLNHINLIVAVEKEFGIKFTTREVYVSKNVGEFIDLIAEKLSVRHSP